MDIESLRYFTVYCKHGNITRAAEELYMTQQGLSRAIRHMGQELGAPLTERRGSKSVLTPFGEEFRQYAESMLLQYNGLLNRISDLTRTVSGEVRIGFALGTKAFLGLELFDDFEERYPSIEIMKFEHEDQLVEEQVLIGELDIGITVHSVDTDLYNSTLLKMGDYFLLCHEKHPLAKRKTIRFADLKDQPIAALTGKTKGGQRLVKHCEEAGFTPNLVERTKEMMVIWEFCLDNRGVAVTSSGRILKNKLGDGDLPLVAVPFDESENYHFKVYMITKNGFPMSYPTQLVQEYLLDAFDE
ncbi:MAG: LysR family transcriptional regulator [Actinomycetes bacterium]|jgi:DNA-binding transcriptional LysR family regulator|nr:LysR family transcriptional regulator [Actinomycetes bacterium]